MARITVSIEAASLLQLMDAPALLTKRVSLGTYIADAVVVDAHPEMARWYGFSDPAHMQGLYLSQLHDRDCLAQIRRYSVARLLGLPGVPESYDMCIQLPNGGKRWLRKDRVRHISDGSDLYWISQSHPIEPGQVQKLPELPEAVPNQTFHQIAGWGTVADVEALIQKAAVSDVQGLNQEPPPALPCPSPARRPQHLTVPALPQALQSVTTTSFELPFDDPNYQRWVHYCGRCERWWVAESARPKKCNHCKSPYWNVTRTRPPRRWKKGA
jgi:hypothetical protein